MLNKNITENQQKTMIRKRDFKEKTRQETKKDTGLMKKCFAIESFDVVIFHETKAKKTEKERKREKEGTKRKQTKKDKERKKRKKRTRERQRKRN